MDILEFQILEVVGVVVVLLVEQEQHLVETVPTVS